MMVLISRIRFVTAPTIAMEIIKSLQSQARRSPVLRLAKPASSARCAQVNKRSRSTFGNIPGYPMPTSTSCLLTWELCDEVGGLDDLTGVRHRVGAAHQVDG